jgi:hypothetical protein
MSHEATRECLHWSAAAGPAKAQLNRGFAALHDDLRERERAEIRDRASMRDFHGERARLSAPSLAPHARAPRCVARTQRR